jgi:hypothetical protein
MEDKHSIPLSLHDLLQESFTFAYLNEVSDISESEKKKNRAKT